MKVCNLFVSPNLQLCFSYKIICTYEATTSLLLRAVRLIKKKKSIHWMQHSASHLFAVLTASKGISQVTSYSGDFWLVH